MAEVIWPKLAELYKGRTDAMLALNTDLRLGATGFTSIAIGQNLAVLPHTDDRNFKDGVQAVLVLGKFKGGEVVFGDENGNEPLIVVENTNMTLFMGTNRTIRHQVFQTTEGVRTIIAFYAKQNVAKFSEVADHLTWEKCCSTRG